MGSGDGTEAGFGIASDAVLSSFSGAETAVWPQALTPAVDTRIKMSDNLAIQWTVVFVWNINVNDSLSVNY